MEYKPEWQDKIPQRLHELGEVFFPMQRGKKGWDYPHHMQEYRHLADSEELNAYFEQGWGYGIACANDLAIVDVDEKVIVEKVTERLPETMWQVSGSGNGYHLFYYVEGMNVRQVLHKKFCGDWVHVGEVKCDPHGYVIGPGSLHPSGNTYGPLHGDTIAEVSKEELLEALSEYIKPNTCDRCGCDLEDGLVYCTSCENEVVSGDYDPNTESEYEFYNLDADDVIPWLERGKRVPHPVHGSSTGTNFLKQDDGELFMCWRHDYGGSQGCALNAQQLLACMRTKKDCDVVRSNWRNSNVLKWKAWREAVDRGLVRHNSIPKAIAAGYAEEEGLIENEDELVGDLYWDVINAIRCTIEEEYLDDKSEMPL